MIAATRKKVCSRCRKELPISAFDRRRHYMRRGLRSECKECRRQDRRNASPVKDYAQYLQKQRVRARTGAAIKSKKLIPQPCEGQGCTASADKVQPHHPSYDGQHSHLQVHWLCRDCHVLEHGKRPWTKQLCLFR